MMSDYRYIFISLLKRSIIALPLFAVGMSLLLRAGDVLNVISSVLFGCAALILGAIIVAFPLARLFAEPSGNLFCPGRRFDRPQPMYGIPQSKKAKGLYEEAIAGFEKIAEEYPEEVQPYVEIIDIAIVKLKEPERANATYQRGMSVLKKDEDKEALARMYSAIRTRLNAKPSN